MKAVAAEAGLYADSIRYYFGSKRGLVEAVALDVSHDLSLQAMRQLGSIADTSERSRAVVDVGRQLAADTSAYRIFWELTPHILRDDQWRQRQASEYEWYRQLYPRYYPTSPMAFADLLDPTDARNLASLMIAVIDGMALQSSLDPNAVDLAGIFSLWQRIVAPHLETLLNTANPDK
jgi:AcrR family transcriptional regulator